MSNQPTILIIDDERAIRKLLEITLQSNGYQVTQAEDAKTGLIMAANHPPDMIILDIGLPDQDGHSVLTALRQWYTQPIMMLSVINSEESVVQALDLGANDYLFKPFRTGELLARVRSALRNQFREANIQPVSVCGDLQIDLANRTVHFKQQPIKLTATEYALLALFVKHEGKVLTHAYLLKEIWGPGYITQSQYLRVYIAQLRKKIEQDPNHPEYILTESGIGYRFICKD